MIVEDHDMSGCLATYGYKLRPDREASLLSSRCGIRQPVGSNHHYSFLKRPKIDISQKVKFLSEYFDRNRSNQDPSSVDADHAEALEIGATFPETRGRSG